jgi:hypothetical protein
MLHILKTTRLWLLPSNLLAAAAATAAAAAADLTPLLALLLLYVQACLCR